MSNTSLLGAYGVLGGSGLMFRNRIINGDMRIDQRYAGAALSITDTSKGNYIVDRCGVYASQASKISAQQNAGAITPPPGFTNYIGVTVGASANVSLANADLFQLYQPIEGFNVADLAYGTANAQAVTLSFWARSSLTGTFSGSLYSTGSYPFQYTINSANTWEYKTITISPNTAYALGSTTNQIGLTLTFDLGAGSNWSAAANSWGAGTKTKATGSVNLVTTNGATLYISGVQLEAGPVATPFEHRPVGLELSLCQRYAIKFLGTGEYEKIPGQGFTTTTTSGYFVVTLPVSMRASPAVNYSGILVFDSTSSRPLTNITVDQLSLSAPSFLITTTQVLTANRPMFLQADGNLNSYFILSAEL